MPINTYTKLVIFQLFQRITGDYETLQYMYVEISMQIINLSYDVSEARNEKKILFTIIILSFWTDRFGQTVQTQIRLLLEEQSDQGLHCLLFHLHPLRFGVFVRLQ